MFQKALFTSILATATILAAPQAVVFDFGGVMTGVPNREAVVHFLCDTFQLSEQEFEKANAKKREAVRSGKTDEEFWLGFAQETSTTLPSDWMQELNAVMKDAIAPNSDMYEIVEQIKARNISVALLSNIDMRLSKLIRGFGLYEPFAPCLLSCEMGVEKPSPEAYKILLDTLGLSAVDVVFIDDKKENIEAAKSIGIDAIWFESTDQVRDELTKRDALKRRAPSVKDAFYP